MNPMENSQITILLSLFAAQVPTFLVCLAAIVVILLRWNEASTGAIWALLGFGLAVILCIAIPVTQAGMQQWVVHRGSGTSAAEARTLLAAVGFAWSILRASSYGLLAVAVFAGRNRTSALSP